MYFKGYTEEWYGIGLRLGFEPDILDAIQKAHQTDEERLLAVLKKWVTGPKRATLLEAILAKKVESASWVRYPFTAHMRESYELEQMMDTMLRIPSPLSRTRIHAYQLPMHTDLPKNERRLLIASLQEDTLAIKKKFQELVADALEELEKHQVPLDVLITDINFACTPNQKVTFNEVKTIKDVFTTATAKGYWCFFSYDRLKRVIEYFAGRNHLQKLEMYDIEFREYCNRRLRRYPSDEAAAEAKVVMLLNDKMGLQKGDMLMLTHLKIQVSRIKELTVTKLIWMEDKCEEPTLGAQQMDEGGTIEETSASALDSAPSLRPPAPPRPPPQRHFAKPQDKD